MGSQRFCLRWNNHQSNLLSVFDQLLHEEAFVDVTLAVEGQHLRAHKMVLSACSPYFQSLFVDHPDKHPIVILKDVPYSDMRSLLDFMYRGEVSVDQDRLTAFLKVAESLKIKGLTEVNEERCDLPSIANSLLGAVGSPQQVVPQQAVTPQVPQQVPCVPQQPPVVQPQQVGQPQAGLPPSPAVLIPPTATTPSSHPPPPNLHRLPIPARRVSPPSFSPLGVPRRKRGRPRKLDCTGPTPLPLPPSTQPHDISPISSDIKYNNIEHNHIHEMANGSYVVKKKDSCLDDDGSQTGIKKDEIKSETGAQDKSAPDEKDGVLKESKQQDNGGGPTNCVDTHKSEPTPSTSSQDGAQEFQNSTTQDGECFMSSKVKTEEENSEHSVENFDDMIDCSPVGSEDEDEGGQAGRGGSLAEKMDEDISQYELDSFQTLMGQSTSVGNPDNLPQQIEPSAANVGDESRRKIDKMSIRKYCTREANHTYRCNVCSKTYTHISNFCRHFLSAHYGHKQDIHCPVCFKPFTRKDNMMTHAKQVHGFNLSKQATASVTTPSDQSTTAPPQPSDFT